MDCRYGSYSNWQDLIMNLSRTVKVNRVIEGDHEETSVHFFNGYDRFDPGWVQFNEFYTPNNIDGRINSSDCHHSDTNGS